MPGAVLWDLDGTLVDSEEYHWRSWHETMTAEGVSVSRVQFVETFGLRNDEILPVWLGPSATADRIARVSEEKEVLYRKLVRGGGLKPLPGAAEWVRHLRGEGWRQAIASSAPRENVDAVLEALGLSASFDAIVSAEDVTAGKPDPQVFLGAARRLGFPPARCVVVEDSAAGIEGARRAGIRSIGVSRNGRLEADLVVQSLAELPVGTFADLVARNG